MKKKHYDIRLFGDEISFEKERFDIHTVDHIRLDHRAFMCTFAFLFFVASVIFCVLIDPAFLILIAGIFFVWLKIEHSRYIELKFYLKDGSYKKATASFSKRDDIYRATELIKERLNEINKNEQEKETSRTENSECRKERP